MSTTIGQRLHLRTTARVQAAPRRWPLHRVLFHVTCVIVAVLFLAPIVITVLASFRAAGEAGTPPLPPWPVQGFTSASYARLDALGTGVLHDAANSFMVALGTSVLTVFVATLAGYGFSRFRMPGKAMIFGLILATMMIPFQSLLTPLFLILIKLGLQNSLIGLVLIYATVQLPFSVFMMRNAFDTVPKEIEEAARLDGLDGLRLLLHVMTPLVMPGIVSVGLFAFLYSWNEFLAALVFLSDQDKYTLPVLMMVVQSGRFGSIDWGAVQAGVTLMMIPCILLFLCLQRYYIRGLTAGSVK
ncbi:carbohydrate ABC transporter permease [Acidisoma cellulosilytica]|uniref:sn-glycerol-3-phosphate transport system permease protein UgpE n=1 Tax=Acidisoma cellulosilyticum TaxID=2802395 RepID=A0A963Z5N9_9PROT|nr:carbohydrate ABC transporter permease [Acidisoma cellulosilyticum]MCB8883108.1 carbohydrate ABC transporter permease [Acidisoma cellulosilyticum]